MHHIGEVAGLHGRRDDILQVFVGQRVDYDALAAVYLDALIVFAAHAALAYGKYAGSAGGEARHHVAVVVRVDFTQLAGNGVGAGVDEVFRSCTDALVIEPGYEGHEVHYVAAEVEDNRLQHPSESARRWAERRASGHNPGNTRC